MIVIPAVVVLGNQLNKLIQEKIKSEKLQKYLNIANECVTDSVIAVAQTYVDKLKDEEWNDETKSEAFIQARERVLQNLGISGKEIITEAMGDFDKWLETKIEAEVKRLENNTPTTLTVLDAVKSEVSK
jgi:hypothetical protein